MLFKLALQYAVRMVQENQEELKLNVTHPLLVSAHNAKLLGKKINTMKKNMVVHLCDGNPFVFTYGSSIMDYYGGRSNHRQN
jgi:hypothetical protein